MVKNNNTTGVQKEKILTDIFKRITYLEKIELFVLNNLVWFLSLAFFIAFSLIVPAFFSIKGIHLIFFSAANLILLVFGQAILLISGNLDLSIAQIAGLSTIITTTFYYKWLPGQLPGFLTIIIVCLIGAILGGINGFLVGKLKLSPFLVTLGTYFIYRWQRYYLLGRTIMASELPRAFLFSGHNEFFGIKVSIFVVLIFLFILYFLLNHTQLGTKIYAIGGNQSAASKLGINVSNITIIVFTISGFLAGISGMLFAGYMNAVTPDIADGYVFLAFAGAILGGISMSGGRGTIGGAAGGTLLLIIIDIGLQLLNIDPYIRLTLRGVFILIAISVEKSRTSLINKILLPNK